MSHTCQYFILENALRAISKTPFIEIISIERNVARIIYFPPLVYWLQPGFDVLKNFLDSLSFRHLFFAPHRPCLLVLPGRRLSTFGKESVQGNLSWTFQFGTSKRIC